MYCKDCFWQGKLKSCPKVIKIEGGLYLRPLSTTDACSSFLAKLSVELAHKLPDLFYLDRGRVEIHASKEVLDD